MIESFKKVLEIASFNQQRSAGSLFFMMILTGIFEAVGAAFLLPFIYVVSDTSIIGSNEQLHTLYQILGFTSADSFTLFLGAVVFFLIVIGFSFRAYSNYSISKYAHSSSYHIGRRLLEVYLSQPYSWFLNRHSASLSKSLLLDSHYLSTDILLPVFQIMAHASIALCFICLLVVAEPMVSLISVIAIGITYLIIYHAFFKRRTVAGKRRHETLDKVHVLAQETIGGIKEIKFFGLEGREVNNFAAIGKVHADVQVHLTAMSELPTYLLQAVAFGGVVGVLLVTKLISRVDITAILPTLTLFAYVGFRLVPTFQKIYSYSSKVQVSKAVLDAMYDDLKIEAEASSNLSENNEQKLAFEKSISLKEISYTYPQSENQILNSISLEIEANTTVGFVGTSGAGKTTLVDIVLGLLKPTAGCLLVDGINITSDNLNMWQNTISYVPQHIFLNDATFAKNIAFGVPKEIIDMARVKMAAQVSALEDAILHSSSNGYDTIIGERGIRLSGGQRQRLGIARALYRNPSVLVLDEATNALDYETEDRIIQNIKDIDSIKTIIIISHRANTLKYCDRIYGFDHGKLKEREIIVMGKTESLLRL